MKIYAPESASPEELSGLAELPEEFRAQLWGRKQKLSVEKTKKLVAQERARRKKILAVIKALGYQPVMAPKAMPLVEFGQRTVYWDPLAPTEAYLHELGHIIAGYSRNPVVRWTATAPVSQLKSVGRTIGTLLGSVIGGYLGYRSTSNPRRAITWGTIGAGIGSLVGLKLGQLTGKALTSFGEAVASAYGYQVGRLLGFKPNPKRIAALQWTYQFEDELG